MDKEKNPAELTELVIWKFLNKIMIKIEIINNDEESLK